MIRKISLFAAAALLVSTVGMATAEAGVPAPHGTLTCGTTGDALILKTGLPGAGQPVTTKKLKLKAKNASIDACNNAGQLDGKEPITGGVASLSGGILPGAGCGTLLTAPPSLDKPKLTMKFTGADGKTVGKATIKALTLTQSGTGFQLSATIPGTPGKNAFAGETLTVQVNVDNLPDAIACIAPGSTTPLLHIAFSSLGGSSISIA